MSTTLSYGFVRPATGDKGSTFWTDLENDITQLNDHTHNGTNSSLLTATSSTATSQSIASGSWSHQGGGTYRQTVTMPAGIAFATHAMQFHNASTYEKLYLSVTRVTSTTYYVYINDNTIDVTVLYT